MPDLWLPGAAGPLDDFVDRLHRRIEAFAAQRGMAAVEVELVDGALVRVKSISAEPGYGFVTLSAYPDDGGEPEEELIVPLGSVRRITLGKAEAKLARFGFSTPEA